MWGEATSHAGRTGHPAQPSGAGWPGTTPVDTVLDRSTGAPCPIDVVVLEVSYTVRASRSLCRVCGRTLRRPESIVVHGTPPPGTHWSATVAARCRSWRRHRHEAVAVLTDDGLLLGRFGPPYGLGDGPGAS